MGLLFIFMVFLISSKTDLFIFMIYGRTIVKAFLSSDMKLLTRNLLPMENSKLD